MYLNDIALFNSLSEENIKKIENISTLVKLNEKDILFYEGDKPKYLHIILEGIIKLYKTDAKGHQLFLYQFTPVSLIGELANFENFPFPATAEAVIKSKVLKVDYGKLSDKILRDPNFSMEIIKSISKKAKILQNVIHQEMILTTEAKIAKLLVEHNELFSQLKNGQIAALINTTPETLSRTITKFKKLNYIIMDKEHKMKIIDIEALKSLYQ